MATTDGGDILSPTVRTAQIITFGLVSGVVSFLAIVVFSVRAGRPFVADPLSFRGPLTPLALIFAAIALVGHKPIRDAIMGRKIVALAGGVRPPATDQHGGPAGAPTGDLPALLGIYLSGKILGMAILEWASFFATIAYMIEGSAAALAAALTLVAINLLTFPTRARVEGWVERQQSRIDEIRQSGG